MKKRKIISSAIVLSGLILFLVIINLPSGTAPTASPANPNPADPNSNLGFQTEQGRNVVTNPTSDDQPPAKTDNLTEQLAQKFSRTVLQINNGFSNGTSSISLPNADSFSNAISDSLNQDLQFPAFGEKDIRIDPDNSSSSQIAYVNAVANVAKKNFAGFSMDIATIMNNFFNKNDSGGLAKYVGIAGKMASDLLALKVPARLSAWHLQNLNLWEKKIVVYQAILNMSSDPLKTSLALQQINNVGQENDILQNVLNDYIKKLAVSG